MEYAERERLSDILAREGWFPPERAVEVALQIATALGTAHDNRTVHGALTPANVLVVQRGGRDLIEVTGWGTASPIEPDSLLQPTLADALVEQLRYMSPEQLIGDPIDARTDVYALGCILFELLTGEPVLKDFEGRSLVRKRLTERTIGPRSRAVRVPEDLDRIVRRALARSPTERFQTASELYAALTLLQQMGSSPPVPTPETLQSPAPVRRTPAPRLGDFYSAREPDLRRFVMPGLALITVVGALVFWRTRDRADPFAGPISQPMVSEPTPTTQSAPLQTGEPAGLAVQRAAAQPVTGRAGTGRSQHAAAPDAERQQLPGMVSPNPPTLQTAREQATRVQPERIPQQQTTRAGGETEPAGTMGDSVRAQLERATRALESGNFASAFGSLRVARSLLEPLRVAYPASEMVKQLSREQSELLTSTVNTCQRFREARISMGLRPPTCDLAGN